MSSERFGQNVGSEGIRALKAALHTSLTGTAIIREPIPLSSSDGIPFTDGILGSLHMFARANPIYLKSHELTLLGTPCVVYDGDNTDYWLGSKKHESNYQPFYSTWILSALVLASRAKVLGYSRLVDIGSGDGRLPYCARVIGLEADAIEIDPGLGLLQKKICSETGVNFNSHVADATQFDYEELKPDGTVFFISALPEHGEMIAKSVLRRVTPRDHDSVGFVLMGSFSHRSLSRDHTSYGWGEFIRENHLEIKGVEALPTQWTTDTDFDTPYVFTCPAGMPC